MAHLTYEDYRKAWFDSVLTDPIKLVLVCSDPDAPADTQASWTTEVYPMEELYKVVIGQGTKQPFLTKKNDDGTWDDTYSFEDAARDLNHLTYEKRALLLALEGRDALLHTLLNSLDSVKLSKGLLDAGLEASLRKISEDFPK